MSSVNKMGENPMLNSLVLQSVFGQGDFVVGDLKNCRQVCSAWYDASLNSWSSSACVVLTGSGNTQKYPDNPNSEVFERYINYRQELEQNSLLKHKPINSFKLKECMINEKNPWMQSFWEKFAANIESLNMEKCTFRRPSTFEEIVYTKTANLHRLVLSGNICGEESESEYLERLQRQKIFLPFFNDFDDQHPQLTQEEAFDLWNDLKTKVKWHKANPDKIQPNLKSLKIENEIPLTRRIPFAFFLAHFPNLEEMEIKTWPVAKKSPKWRELQNVFLVENILESVQGLRETDKTRFSIKKLDIMDLCPLTTPYFDNFLSGRIRFAAPGDLNEGHLPLEVLNVDLGLQSIACVLKIHAKTLQVLRAFRAPYCKPRHSTGEPGLIPEQTQMPAMKELHLFGDVVSSLGVLECTPNLRVLCVERWCYTKREKLAHHLADREKPLREFADVVRRSIREGLTIKMEHLEHFDIDVSYDKHSIRCLSRWMPNLTVVKMIVKNETLDLICTVWPQIIELTLKFQSIVNDQGMEALIRLKYLRKFTLEACCNTSRLTDKSGEMFEKMEHLDFLQICVSKQMSEEMEQRVKNSKITNVKFIRNYGCRDHEYECCSRVTFHADTR